MPRCIFIAEREYEREQRVSFANWQTEREIPLNKIPNKIPHQYQSVYK